MSEKNRTFRLKDSIFIGVVCIFSYLVSYYSRHLASVTSPSMLEEGIFTESFYSLLTSVYMVTYASGQLFNGIIGDLFNPKRLITYGLCGTAVTSIAFAFLPFNWMRLICYGLLGFSLSMLRGPLVKIIAENTSLSVPSCRLPPLRVPLSQVTFSFCAVGSGPTLPRGD